MAFTMEQILEVAATLFDQGVPKIADSEYSRGVFELIGRLALDIGGEGDGTHENAVHYSRIVDEMVPTHATENQDAAD